MQCRMGRVKLKIKRLETTGSILDTYAKRKSIIMIQEALLKEEEEQKARVKELEVGLKQLDAELNKTKEIKNTVHELTAIRKSLEGRLKEGPSLHTPSQDPKRLRRHDALLKKHEALVKQITEKKKVMNEVLIIADQQTLEGREKLISNIDVERAKVKQLEQNRKEIEKGAYRAIKESLRNKLASNLNLECAEDIKQLEQNRKEIEKEASLTSKEGLKKKFDSDVDAERVNAKQSEKNQKETVCNFVESGKDQFANDAGQTLALNPELPLSMEEAAPFDMVNDDKNVSIQIGRMKVPWCPKPSCCYST